MTIKVSPDLSVKRIYTIHAVGQSNWAAVNAPLAERFYYNTHRNNLLADLADCTQVRFQSVIMAASASVNTPKLRLRYFTSWSSTFASYLQLGLTQHVDLSTFTGTANTLQDSGWLDLALGARANGVALALCELGGDGVADPAIGHTQAWFR